MPQTGKPLVCPHLLNDNPCPDQNCAGSHSLEKIKRWKKNKGSTPCQFGTDCQHMRDETCVFYHSQDERMRAEQNRKRRATEMMRGLTHLETVMVDELLVGDDILGITQERQLASFNRVYDNEIVVPGLPPRLKPLSNPCTIPPDAKNDSLRVNFPRYTYSLEPLLRSVESMEPTFDVASCDVVSGTGVLQRLLEFLKSPSPAADRYEAEIKDDTLYLARWSQDPQRSQRLGYGAGFEQRTCRYADHTTPIILCASSYHSVVAYRLGGLQCAVQSEVDAHYCECHPRRSPSPLPGSEPEAKPTTQAKRRSDPLPRPAKPHPAQNPPRSPLSSAFAALSLDDPGDSPSLAASKQGPVPPDYTDPSPLRTSTPSLTLTILHSGDAIPLSCLVEVKTQGATRTAATRHGGSGGAGHRDYCAQLYFARRTQLYVAQHTKGVFEPLPRATAVQDMRERLRLWEAEHQVQLRQLVALLKAVKERSVRLREEGVKRVVLICKAGGMEGKSGLRMEVYKGEAGGLVPP